MESMSQKRHIELTVNSSLSSQLLLDVGWGQHKTEVQNKCPLGTASKSKRIYILNSFITEVKTKNFKLTEILSPLTYFTLERT